MTAITPTGPFKAPILAVLPISVALFSRLSLIFYNEDGGSMLLRNRVKLLPDHTA
jgi:hypothetical protein